MALVQRPEEAGELEEVGEDGVGREVLRLSLWQSFFFILFSPFFLCKKCTKAQQPLCIDQQCFLGERVEGTPGLAPQPATEGGLILLRNVGFSLNTRQ